MGRPVVSGHLRIAVAKDLAKAVLAETEALPETLRSATWIGFMRGMVAKAAGEVIYLHESGRA